MSASFRICLVNSARLIICGFFCMVFFQTPKAQELPSQTGARAIVLAKEIESKNLTAADDWAEKALESESLEPTKQLRLLRHILTDTLYGSTQTDLNIHLDTYDTLTARYGNETDQKIGRLFRSIASVFDAENRWQNQSQIEQKIAPYLTDSDWFVRHRALTLASLSYSYASETSIALEKATASLKVIPESDTLLTIEAKTLSTSTIRYLHNLLGNTELSVAMTEDFLELSAIQGDPIDGVSIISNLVYAFSKWRDHETSGALVDILIRVEAKIGSEGNGLTEYRASIIYNQLGQFEKALRYSEAAISKSEGLVSNISTMNRIVALAGLGRVEEAESALNTFDTSVSKAVLGRQSIISERLYALGLIESAKGNYVAAQNLMNQRLDTSIQNLMASNNNETSNMLASLQNTKDRQDEREAALKRESELKQLALDRQRRVIVLLIAVAVILTILTFGTAAFARFRAKAARKMKIAAEKARAGEKAKSEFLAVMSHELRTPLNGILGMADILSRSAPTDALREKNNIILQSGNELLALVENIFDMTLLENDDVELDICKADVHAMIETVCNKWHDNIQSDRVAFTAYVDPAVPQFMNIDATRAGQCLDHLLSNAAKFTLEGRVHVHITAAANDTGEGAPTELTLIVADTGVGISDEAHARLFQPFVQADSSMTRQYGGAGLGLAITRSLARLMEGDLTVNSRENKGSEFTLTLSGTAIVPEIAKPQDPRRAPQPAPEPPVSTVASPIMQDSSARPNRLTDMISVQGQRFLVVEDDIACQDVVKSLLEPTLSQVTCVGNGHEALQALSVNTYDFVIMDIRMPGMDGVTAARRIRKSGEAHANVPIIALTADVAAETNAKCMIAGVDMFLTKPVRAEEFYRAIELVSRKTKAIQQKQKRIA